MAMTLHWAPEGTDAATKVVLLDSQLDDDDVTRIFRGIDVSYARCTVPDEQIFIYDQIKEHFSTSRDPSGQTYLTMYLKLHLAESVLRRALEKRERPVRRWRRTNASVSQEQSAVNGRAVARSTVSAGCADTGEHDGKPLPEAPTLDARRGLKFHAFLSHDWGTTESHENHEKVIRISEGLIKRGLKVWIDVEQMRDKNILHVRP